MSISQEINYCILNIYLYLEQAIDKDMDKITVLGMFPPGKFPPERSSPVYSPEECSPPKKTEYFFRLVAAWFQFVARFARVRIEDSSRNRFASTAYFAKPR